MMIFILLRYLKNGVKKKVYFEGDKIIQFNSMGTGFLEKKPFEIINDKIKIHRAVTHLYNPGASQVTIGCIKKFLKITKGQNNRSRRLSF